MSRVCWAKNHHRINVDPWSLAKRTTRFSVDHWHHGESVRFLRGRRFWGGRITQIGVRSWAGGGCGVDPRYAWSLHLTIEHLQHMWGFLAMPWLSHAACWTPDAWTAIGFQILTVQTTKMQLLGGARNIRHGKLTWNPKMEVWKMIFLFN